MVQKRMFYVAEIAFIVHGILFNAKNWNVACTIEIRVNRTPGSDREEESA